MRALGDNVQNHLGILPLFFIGCSPSQAASIINPDYPAAGVMISANSLRSRKSDFKTSSPWIMDSGAFTELSRFGKYRSSVEDYAHQISRWANVGHLLCAVAQDYMCEPFILERTGLSVEEHQRLTIERFERLCSYPLPVKIMPVIQGYKVSDYIAHVQQYNDRLDQGEWVGVGSVCRRNGSPEIIGDILRAIKLIRPDLRLHGFGLKQTALENQAVRELLYSCDSMAWSMPRRFKDLTPTIELAHNYQAKVSKAVTDSVQKRIPVTAGAGNGQGRKPKWNNPKTKAIRVPEDLAERLLDLARQWDESRDNPLGVEPDLEPNPKANYWGLKTEMLITHYMYQKLKGKIVELLPGGLVKICWLNGGHLQGQIETHNPLFILPLGNDDR
uniref:DeoxyPurine in DNA protein A domain-containing protein n=2 Tax=Gloeothece TaxID=28070 RepID=E0UCC7_GLOV7|nr:hypothetical protein Cyan7822_0864 [Gloeothece verrucosa PCC 7822]